MINPKEVNMNEETKKVCIGMVGSSAEGVFAIGMVLGKEIESYSLSPKAMKSCLNYLNELVGKYQEKYGGIIN